MANKLGIQVNLMPQVKRTELQKSVNTAVKEQALNVKVTPTVTKKALRDALQKAASGNKPISIAITPKVNVNQFVKDVSAQLSNLKAVTVEVNPVLSKNFAKEVNELTSTVTSSNTQKSKQNNSQTNDTDALRVLAKEQRLATQTANFIRTTQAYINDNPKIRDNVHLLNQILEPIEALKKGEITLDEAKSKVAALRLEFFSLGKETTPVFSTLKKLFRDHLGTQAVLLGINAIRKSIAQMVLEVIALDTAMTELKKVTDETDQTYMQFLDSATIKAQKLGATISDVVTATADFARLGYNLGDAEQLAEAAIVYKNVGDGIEDISVASSSIISTMKAFGIEADNAMNIVDIFNKIGNEFAISSVGIGEALSRSAAGLAETNNTLAESVALITAANTVVGFMPLIYGDIGISR